MRSVFGTSILRSAIGDLPYVQLRQVDIYRELNLTPDRQVQGGDIVRFIEWLIAVTQARVVLWKAVNKHSIKLHLVFRLECEDESEAINPEDAWTVILEKIQKEQKVFFGMFTIHKTCFYLKISNRFHHHPEDIGRWEVMFREKQNLLSIRLEMLWEVVFTNRLRKTMPTRK